MTKDELQVLLSDVYGANVWSSSGYWNIHIETMPPREIIFTEYFVNKYIGQPGERLDQLREMLAPVTGDRNVQDTISKQLLFSDKSFEASD